jgi:hypothetical protein
MSELKAINAYRLTTNTEDSDVYIHNDEFGCGGDLVECYLKSEADKVIAELKDDCSYWKTMSRKCADDNEVMAKQRADAFKRECNQKYKRCLAMAKWCDTKADWYYGIGRSLRCRVDFFIKWRDKWLKIAEKFREVK